MKRRRDEPKPEFEFKYRPPPRFEEDTKGVAALMYRNRRVAVVGSRDFTNRFLAFSALDAFQEHLLSNKETISAIVSGEARGADAIGKEWAKRNKVSYNGHPPVGDLSNPAVYHERNQKIVDDSHIIIAFWDMKSRGTLSTINKAKAAKKHVEIIDTTADSVKKVLNDN